MKETLILHQAKREDELRLPSRYEHYVENCCKTIDVSKFYYS